MGNFSQLFKYLNLLENPYLHNWSPNTCNEYEDSSRSLFKDRLDIPPAIGQRQRKKASETTTSKGLVVYAAVNSKEHQTQRTIGESYESEREKRIVFDKLLPKWNYVVKCKSG